MSIYTPVRISVLLTVARLAQSLGRKKSFITTVFLLHVLSVAAFAAPVTNPELIPYESARELSVPQKGMTAPRVHGWKILERDAENRATRAELTLLVDNPLLNGKLFLIGPFNKWGAKLREADAFAPVAGKPHLMHVQTTDMRNGTPYRIMLNGRSVLDPAASMYSTLEYAQKDPSMDPSLNSIFWDVEDPNNYQIQTDFVDISDKPNLIGEVELHSLIAKYRDAKGQVGPNFTADTYRFIAESGVIDKLRDAGYVAIEMLPFNQSIDGASWHLRYQSYGLFAPDSRYGNPNEFKQMIDAFHRGGLAVIMDSVISHWPYSGNKDARTLDGIGMDQWVRANGEKLYVGPESPWGTYRFVYSNPRLADFLVDSITYMMTEFKIDGLRMDNIDGIIETPGGELFLKRLINAARGVNPRALIIAESFDGHKQLLHSQEQGGWGFNTKTDYHNFDIWKDTLQGPARRLGLRRFAELLEEGFKRGEGPVMRYITNHDEAANRREGFTGEYPATLLKHDKPDVVFGKIKTSDSLAMLAGSYHVSLPQARMMQTGSFYSNAVIDWSRIESGRGEALWTYFSSLGQYIQSKKGSFNFESLNSEIANHVDRTHPILSMKRVDPVTGKMLYILINFGPKALTQYSFGVSRGGMCRLAFDSELAAFGGNGKLSKSLNGRDIEAKGDKSVPNKYSLNVPIVDRYSITIFEER